MCSVVVLESLLALRQTRLHLLLQCKLVEFALKQEFMVFFSA